MLSTKKATSPPTGTSSLVSTRCNQRTLDSSTQPLRVSTLDYLERAAVFFGEGRLLLADQLLEMLKLHVG